MLNNAKWITHPYVDEVEVLPIYKKNFTLSGNIKSAKILATSLGVYELSLNGVKVGDAFFAPGWTNYKKRLQVQTYDITAMLRENNNLEMTVANGWFKGCFGFMGESNNYGTRTAALAEIIIEYEDDKTETIATDDSWSCTTGSRRYSEIYHGEMIDYTFMSEESQNAVLFEYTKDILVAQECEPVRITKRLKPQKLIQTPKGEVVLDFGQNLSGVIEAKLNLPKGTKITLKHAEVLDKDGNFYTENLRDAKATDTFITSGGDDVFLPIFTFHGFRYLQIIGLDGEPNLDDFTACVLHTDMKQTGHFKCSHDGVTRLQSNIEWGQRSNFLDIPTDCPQRNERLGWTGDAQIFASTAAFNFDVLSFFKKWLRDLVTEQSEQFGVPGIVPNIMGDADGSAAWGDAATIIPWVMYEAYGDIEVLREQYDSMKGWVEYIRSKAGDRNLWQTGFQYGDWVALDKEEGSDRVGATDIYLIATAFYAYSTDIVAKTAKLLGRADDEKEYTKLYCNIVTAFQNEYITRTGRMASETQTACILALHFNLAPQEHRERILQTLVGNIKKHNNHLVTGFVGTPYILHTLSDNGEHDLAGTIFLKRDFPSWLYAVDLGATTIWERWNSMKKDGSFDESGMNSFNHYAYGSVGDWMYKKLAGIQMIEPAYKKSRIAPMPIQGITWVDAGVETPYGELSCYYKCEKGKFFMDIQVPENTTTTVKLPGKDDEFDVTAGKHHYEYETDMVLELELGRYSMDSSLGEIMANPLAMQVLTQYAPEIANSPMIQLVLDKSIAEITPNMPESGAQLFEMVIAQINAAEKENTA